MSEETQPPLSRLVPDAAQRAHADLIEALGSDHRDDQWMVFMDAVERWIPPEVFQSSGRPSREQIARSPIGQLGFASWGELVTADRQDGGLGLPWSRWKEWRRSWAVVRKNHWLRECNVSASSVKQLAERVRKMGVEFPASLAEWEQFDQERQQRAASDRQESIAALKEQVSDLSGRIEDAEHRARRHRRHALERRMREREALRRAEAAESAQAKAEGERDKTAQKGRQALKERDDAVSERDEARKHAEALQARIDRSWYDKVWDWIRG